MLTPIDIRDKEFDKGRNYTREVREFLLKVSSEYEVIYSKNVELNDRLEHMEALLANYKNIEETMKNALVLAQKTADSTIEAAHKEAENILMNARMEANKLYVESIDKNNRVKIANKAIYDRFNTYKKLCLDVVQQHMELINSIDINIDDEDINVKPQEIIDEVINDISVTDNNEEDFTELDNLTEDELMALESMDEFSGSEYDELANLDDLDDFINKDL